MSAGTFARYLIYGFFVAFFLVFFIKFGKLRRQLEIAVGILVFALIFFFLFSRSMFLFKLGILEFFILGLLAALDNRKARSYLPFLLILGAACLVEVVTNTAAGTRFYYLDVWVHSLAALSGYVSGHLTMN
jgi:fructose-specific phosphotransferase system IIC component